MRRLLFLSLLVCAPLLAATPYDIGSPVLRDVFVDPVNGSDANSGEQPRRRAADAGRGVEPHPAGGRRSPPAIAFS